MPLTPQDPDALVPPTDPRRRVLVTGATGGIGALLMERLDADYELVPQGRTPNTPEMERRLRRVDLTDYPAVEEVMNGIDTVVHLAGASSPESSWEDVLEANIVGTRHVLEAARVQGVRRVVYASSNHAMGMYDRLGEWPVYPASPPRPDSLYGVSKVFGETLGRYYHDEYDLDFIALRIGWSIEDPDEGPDVDLLRAMWLSEDDTVQVVRCAIEADVRFFASTTPSPTTPTAAGTSPTRCCSSATGRGTGGPSRVATTRNPTNGHRGTGPRAREQQVLRA